MERPVASGQIQPREYGRCTCSQDAEWVWNVHVNNASGRIFPVLLVRVWQPSASSLEKHQLGRAKMKSDETCAIQ